MSSFPREARSNLGVCCQGYCSEPQMPEEGNSIFCAQHEIHWRAFLSSVGEQQVPSRELFKEPGVHPLLLEYVRAHPS